MNEKLNLKRLLRNKTKDIDSKYGLPKNIRQQERVPIEVLNEFHSGLGPNIKFLLESNPDMAYLFEVFQKLPKDVKDYIIKDFKDKKEQGMEDNFLLDHLCILISRYNDFLNMDVSSSDKIYKPKPSQQKLEIKEIDALASKNVAQIMQQAEEASIRTNVKNKGADKYKN